jgi:hypothetical protein
MQPRKEREPGLREQLHELRAREHSGQDHPPVNGEFELLGEFRGNFVAGANGQRDISSGSRDFNNSRGFGSSRSVNSNRGLSSNDKYNILTTGNCLEC